jgi:DNA-directed RNA polymerase specialized sigma subunit
MANEEMEYETIIRETDTPSRASAKDKKVVRVAKLTSRTFKALKAAIHEKRLSRAYKKYNEKYAKMRRALKDANELRNSYENGEDITQSQVAAAYDIVAKYDRKLSKFAVRLLTDDIKTAVAGKKPKPIRVPRILLGKLRPITRAILKLSDKHRTKKLQKELTKEMKSTTRDYIESSLDGALFKDAKAGVLQDHVDAAVIKNLAIDKGADTFEDKIANLRRFISADGKTPLYGDEEIAVGKPGTNLPPAEPTASVEKTEPKVDLGALTKGLSEKKESTVESTADQKKEDKPVVTSESLTAGLGAIPKAENEEIEQKPATGENAGTSVPVDNETELSDKDQEIISRRQREISSIVSLQNSIQSLEAQLGNVNDPATRTAIEGMIGTLNSELRNIIDRSVRNSKKTGENESIIDKKNESSTTDVLENPVDGKPATDKNDDGMERLDVVDVPDIIKPEEDIIKSPVQEQPTQNPVVTITNPPVERVSQSGEPSKLIVTPDVLAEMQKRNEAAKAKIASLTTEIESLKKEKALYEKYIEVANATRDNERAVSELSATRNATATEVAELANTAATIFKK